MEGGSGAKDRLGYVYDIDAINAEGTQIITTLACPASKAMP